MRSVWTVSSHWGECCGTHTFPTKAVIHSVSLHYFQSSQQELSPLPPFIFPEFHPHFRLRLVCELKLFSLLSLSSPSAGWVVVSSTFVKKQAVGQSHGENAETSLEEAPAQQRHSCATVEEGPTGLAGFRNGLSHSSSEELSGKGEVFRAMGSATSEDEALGDCPSSAPMGDSTHAESSHCLKLMLKQ